MGLAFITPIYAIWYIIEVGLSLHPRANLLIALLISILTVGWASPMVWGILGGSMPRSGGEYIYNSRIINPMHRHGGELRAAHRRYLLELLHLDLVCRAPRLAILAQYMGWTGFSNLVASKAGTCILCAVCIVGRPRRWSSACGSTS